MHSLSRGCVATALLLAAVTQISAPSTEAAAAGTCAAADSQPGQASYAALGRASVCLVNRERRERGMVPLRADRRLARAAAQHARDMVRYAYFAHDSRSGADFSTRIVKSGYLRGAGGSWWVGENLAWGRGRQSTPRRVVRGWMKSPSHRANVLEPNFRDIGVSVIPGAPLEDRHGVEATYVHDFGVRR